MPHSHPTRIIIVPILILTSILEQQFIGISAENSALSEAKLKEIAKIRAELNEALDTEQEDAADKGVIVQPGWTAGKEQKTDAKIQSKVEVTKERIEEVKALREEISKSHIPHEETVKQLVKEFEAQNAGREALEKIVGATKDTVSEEFVGAAEQSDTKDKPNLVNASGQDEVHEFDLRKLQRLEVSKRRMRETLILQSVEEDFTFNLGEDVQQWAHIMHNGSEYFVGRREQSLLVVHKESATYEKGTIIDVGQPISYLLTYSFWNDEQAQTEGITLVATADRVLWYRVNNETSNVELYWRWVVGNTITGLTYFTVEGKDYLVVSTDKSSYTGFFMLNIYQFELASREFWIVQRMQLKYPCVETTLLDTGRDILLAVPQNDTAAIYSFNPRADDSDHLRFQLKQHVQSALCEYVAGFKMGGRSYLAIGGESPQILLYQQGELVQKTILAHNFGVVELFFPVPVRTYRDDLILLVQHRVDFSTHSLTVLETLIWDGEAFEASIPVPCKLGQHTVYGVSCMLDVQLEAGLKGAAYFRRNDEVSIIVPRRNAESGLFRLHTQLLARNSEYLDLQEIFAFLKDWVKEQDDLIALAQQYLEMSDNASTQALPDLSELEELQTPEFVLNSGEVGEIYVNDYHWTDADTQLDLNELLTAIEQLDTYVHSARHRREVIGDELIFEYLELDSLDVDELFVQQLNGEKFYVQDGSLYLNGVLNTRELEVLEQFEVPRVLAADDESLAEENETLVFDGDMQFESINGVRWKDLQENMILTNSPLNFTELQVDGEVVVENKLSLNALNSLNFPDDYLWSSGPTESVVNAEKTFTQTLSVNALKTDGLLNGMNASDAITLTDAQEWRGTPTFADLKVTGTLELNGTTRGRDIGNIPNNPSLRDAKQVEGICSFRELHVNGPLVVRDSLDGQPLELVLSDVLQRPSDAERVVSVRAKKYFADVNMPIDFQILDGKVNGIPAEQFVPAHTKQDLKLDVLKAYVYFANLTLKGKYDGVDIEELLQNAIKINEPQTALDTHLYLAHGLEAKHLEISSSLNDVTLATGYQTIYEDMDLPFAHFEQLEAKEATIHGNVSGSNGATWNGAKSKEATDLTEVGNIYIEELELEDGIEVDEIQGLNVSLVWNFLDEVDDILEMVLDGKILVDHVVVTGDVLVHKLNEQRFDEDLQLTIIWLNRPNFLSTSLRFNAPLIVHEKLNIEGRFNGRDLPALLNDIVFRESRLHTIEVLATKSFTQSVNVLGDTHVEALNGIPFSDIATKKSICSFGGSVRVHGNLVVRDLELRGALNGYAMSTFNNLIRYDTAFGAFIVRGVLNFTEAPMFLQDLTVLGKLNGMPHLAQFFDELIYKDRVSILKGHNAFTGRVRIDKGAYIGRLNGLNLLSLFENIVYVNEPLPVLMSAPVVFNDSVRANNLFIGDSLAATKLNGNMLEEWFNDTLRLDRPQEIEDDLIFASRTLDGNSFFVNRLNDIDLSEIVTLYTAQNLTGNVSFSELHLDGEIRVNGSVNDVDLKKEYENTLMTHGNQHVITPLTLLHATLVQGNLTTSAPINNDIDLRELATLQGDQHFESPLFFEYLETEQVKTKFPISGINMDVWFQATLQKRGKEQQFIIGNWSVDTLNVKSGPTLPSYVNSLRPSLLPFDGLVRSARERDGYVDLCEKLKQALKMQQKRGYYLKYLEQSFELNAQEIAEDETANATIHTVFALAKDGISYLLLNIENRTQVMTWNAKKSKYVKVANIETGQIDQVLGISGAPAEYSNSMDFVTNKARENSALRYWRLANKNLTLMKTFENPAADLMLSKRKPTNFYAVHNDIVYGYDLNLNLHTDTWFLPNFLGSDQYRFVPQHEHGLMFTNGGIILLFGDNDADGDNDDEHNMRDKRTSIPRYSLPLSYQRVMSPQPYKLNETLLKPNAKQQTHRYRLSDFRSVIGHILDDLNYRLRLEVNITQLSIPETDLRDEHLLRDTLSIMEEMRLQQIYPNISFAPIELDGLKRAKNPALILAARTAQILWPCIVDMEEIHGYLHSSDDEGDVTVERIIADFGATVHDVLSIANSKDNEFEYADDNTHAHELAAVIERIRYLQDQLQNTLRELKRQELNEALYTKHALFDDEDFEMSANTLVNATQAPPAKAPPTADFVTLTLADSTWLKYANKNLPSYGNGEILSILVRPQTMAPLELLAVTFKVSPVASAQSGEIVLYSNVLQSQRFQTISAREARSLITFQIAADTLFAYVDDCCMVRVLIYSGVQGFVEFARFTSHARVLKIFHVMLAGREMLVQQPHLVVAHAESLVFYRFVGAGSLLHIPENFICN
ncbi:uncharacterized protein fs(1)N isoform X2 [Eurosta solidaginis]|uniref:uncharacterized protein fs(1)N isoform X2 n=1 Tax=Eurosta solidaginis TaxID=178769 RepID=UPI0035307293